MRTLSPSLHAKVDSGVTTLAYAWRLTRTDGLVVAVTQHDCDLVFAGTTFLASRPLIGSECEHEFNLTPDRTALSGAFASEAIHETDLALGRWNDARVEAFQVDWENPAEFIPKWSGRIAGATWQAAGFELDIVGVEAVLSANVGRVYARTCDAILGDSRCGVNLTAPNRFVATTLVSQMSDREVTISAPLNRVVSDFTSGRAIVTSGVAAGWQADMVSLKTEQIGQATYWRICVSRPFPVTLSHGDSLTIYVGCDKAFATCKARFANGLNFRGQPTMPGDDVAFGGPAISGNSGGKR